MGYHISIIRTQGRRKIPITQKEVEESLSGKANIKFDTQVGKIEYFKDGDLYATLMIQGGEIWTKVYEREVIELMIQLSLPLNARVRGDSFETYKTATDTYTHPDDIDEMEESEKESKRIIRSTKRRTILVNGSIFGLFIVAGMIVSHCSQK